MIVALASLKLALGIGATDTTQDPLLLQLEAWATAWVEKQYERRFREPQDRVEVRQGSGTRELILAGIIDNPDAVLTVRERWTVLSEPTDVTPIELRDKRRVIRADGHPFYLGVEYELTYPDGYSQAPGDIQQLVSKLVGIGLEAYRQNSDAQAGTGGITDETIGDYSYSIDPAAAQAAQAAMSGFLTDTEQRTHNRWKKLHI